MTRYNSSTTDIYIYIKYYIYITWYDNNQLISNLGKSENVTDTHSMAIWMGQSHEVWSGGCWGILCLGKPMDMVLSSNTTDV